VTMRPAGSRVEGLRALVRLLPAGGTVVEVGCYAGESMVIWLERADRYYGVDPWVAGWDPWDGLRPNAEEMLAAEAAFDLAASDFPGVVTKIRLPSLEAVKRFSWASVDAVYLDGSHEFHEVVRDILAWRPVVRPGGFLSGHDYGEAHYPGVAAAVVQTLGFADDLFSDSSWVKML
jgi:hypothetical protein